MRHVRGARQVWDKIDSGIGLVRDYAWEVWDMCDISMRQVKDK